MIIERVPDVVLLDVHMPSGGGLAVLRAVNDKDPSVRFLALSVSDASEEVISIIRAGARGYETKNISGPDLLDAIYRVAAGDAVFSPRLAGFVLDAFSLEGKHLEAGDVDPDLDLLTPRERQVLRLIARGYSYRDIATELEISREDSRESRLVGVAQAAALQSPPTLPLGQRATPHVAIAVR